MAARNYRRQAEQKPTWTSLVVKALHEADDFQTRAQLVAATGGTMNQIAAALHHLKGFDVLDCLESDGHLYWYLTGRDRRTQVTEMRTPEEPGTRSRRKQRHLTLVQPPKEQSP